MTKTDPITSRFPEPSRGMAARHEPPYPPGDGRGVLAHPRLCRNSTSAYTDAQERIRDRVHARSAAHNAARPACGWRVVDANEGWGPSFLTIVRPQDDKVLGAFGQGSVLSPAEPQRWRQPGGAGRSPPRPAISRKFRGLRRRSPCPGQPSRPQRAIAAPRRRDQPAVQPSPGPRSLRRSKDPARRRQTVQTAEPSAEVDRGPFPDRGRQRVTTRRRGWRVVGANAVSGPSLSPILRICTPRF
jgi:hypothetical protein